jgi:hypothetical protein
MACTRFAAHVIPPPGAAATPRPISLPKSAAPFFVFLAGLGLLMMPGCAYLATGAGTTLTPRQQYQNAAGIYDVVVIGIAVQSKGSVSPSVLAAEKDAQAQLQTAAAWLSANPSTADTPGAAYPPLAPLTIAVNVLQNYLHNLPLAPIDVPASQSAPMLPG